MPRNRYKSYEACSDDFRASESRPFSGSVPRRMLSTFAGPVQLAQAAAQGFNFLFVGNILPLGQFEGFQNFLHVVERASECLDDVVDLFDGFLDSHWLRGSRLANLWSAIGFLSDLSRQSR